MRDSVKPWRKQAIDEACETCHLSLGDDGP